MLANMISLAATAHMDQTDKGGRPYILHCLQVMYNLDDTEYEIDDELRCIAVGHDLIEDTWVAEYDLYDYEFSDRVIDGIIAMTKKKGQSYSEYKNQVFSNRDAMIVKLCDLRHNSDIRRLKGVTEKDLQRLSRYAQFYTEIKERLCLT